MTRIPSLIALTLAALPLLAQAQTANTPGGQAATGTPIDQTRTTPGKNAPSTTATSPSANNPTGTLNKGSDAMSTDGGDVKAKTNRKPAKSTAPAGDVPTYPAPAKDGTPTK